MTKTPVAGNVEQTLDIKLYFAAQCAFGFELVVDDVPDSGLFIVIPFVHFPVEGDASLGKNITGGGISDSVDIGESYFASFVFG